MRASPPKTFSGRGLCIVAKHQFPCPGSSGVKNNVEPSLCDAEYFFWDAEDCGIMSNKHPYVCERKADKIGKFFFLSMYVSISTHSYIIISLIPIL